MSVRTEIEKEVGIYFITITCHKWLPLFQMADAYESIFNWFRAMERDENKIAAFVVLPNHLHVLIEFNNVSKSVNQYVANGKRFIAYDIVKKLRAKNLNELLNKLQEGVNTTQKNLGKKHEVFEPSFECKRCMTNAFTLQKLNYIHNNPVKGKWKLVENPVDYKYSSMKQYETGKSGVYAITLIQSLEHFSFL